MNKNIFQWCAAHFVIFPLPHVTFRPMFVSVCLLVIGRKRSLGQGNVFTHVCHSVHGRGDWLPSMHHRSHDHLGVHLEGGLPTGGVCIQGLCIWRSICIQGDLHREGSACRVVGHTPLPTGTGKVGCTHLLQCFLVFLLSVCLCFYCLAVWFFIVWLSGFLLSVCVSVICLYLLVSIVYLSLCVSVIYLCLSFCMSPRVSGVRLAV